MLFSAKDVFENPLLAPCALMIEWNYIMTDKFEDSTVNTTSLMLQVGEMLVLAPYTFFHYDQDKKIYVVDIIKFDSLGDYFLPKAGRTKELMAVLQHPKCFMNNENNWNKLFGQ